MPSALEQLLSDRQNRLSQTGAAIPFLIGSGPLGDHLSKYIAPSSVAGAHTAQEYAEMVDAATARDEEERRLQEAILRGDIKFSRQAPSVSVKGAFGGASGLADEYRRKAEQNKAFGLEDYWLNQAKSLDAMAGPSSEELAAQQEVPVRLEDIVGSDAFAPLRDDQRKDYIRTLPGIGMTREQAIEKFKADNNGLLPSDFESKKDVFRGGGGGYNIFQTVEDKMVWDENEGRYRQFTGVPTGIRAEKKKQNSFDSTLNKIGAGIIGAGLGVIGGAPLGGIGMLAGGALGGGVSGYTGRAPSGSDVLMAGIPLTGKLGGMSNLAKLSALTQMGAGAYQKVSAEKMARSMSPDRITVSADPFAASSVPSGLDGVIMPDPSTGLNMRRGYRTLGGL